MTKLCGVYLLTHIASGLKYVGQSIDIRKRWYQHSRGLCKMRLGQSIKKHGWESFSASVLELCDAGQLNEVESRWIATHNCISPNGYNLTSGGSLNATLSEETRQRISAANKGLTRSDEVKARLVHIGLNRSDEYKKKISDANKARVYTPELVEKLSSGNKGREFSAEHRAKIGEASRNRSAETRKKLATCKPGRVHSEETKAKMRTTKAANKLLRQSAAA